MTEYELQLIITGIAVGFVLTRLYCYRKYSEFDKKRHNANIEGISEGATRILSFIINDIEKLPLDENVKYVILNKYEEQKYKYSEALQIAKANAYELDRNIDGKIEQ